MTDATIPETSLVFGQNKQSHYGGFVFCCRLDLDQVEDANALYHWCCAQFGHPYTASFEGLYNDSVLKDRLSDPSNRRWSFHMVFPRALSGLSQKLAVKAQTPMFVEGNVNVVFYDRADATLFRMVILK